MVERDGPTVIVRGGSCPLLLLRHCEATGQDPDAPLTERGVAQARALVETLLPLGVTRIVSSPWERARASAAPLSARLGVRIEQDARLVERRLSGRSLPDWRERLRDSFASPAIRLDGGESTDDARERVAAVLEGATPGTLLVTHGNLLALALAHLDGVLAFDRWEALTSPDIFRVEAGCPIERIALGLPRQRAARALIVDGAGRVLLARHVERSGRAVWAMPGGRLEEGEAFEAALVREINEELGLPARVSGEAWRDEVTLVSDGRLVRQEQRFFDVTLPDDMPPRARDVVELRWWTPRELETSTLEVFPADLAVRLRRAP